MPVDHSAIAVRQADDSPRAHHAVVPSPHLVAQVLEELTIYQPAQRRLQPIGRLARGRGVDLHPVRLEVVEQGEGVDVRARQPVQALDDHRIEPPARRVGQQALDARPVGQRKAGNPLVGIVTHHLGAQAGGIGAVVVQLVDHRLDGLQVL